jgi:hypothetical protein
MFSENILSRKPFKFVMVLVKLVAYFSVPHAAQKSFISPLMFAADLQIWFSKSVSIVFRVGQESFQI